MPLFSSPVTFMFWFLQKIGDNFVKSYKYELLRHMSDIEDAAAWLIVWSLPVGKLTLALRHGKDLDLGD